MWTVGSSNIDARLAQGWTIHPSERNHLAEFRTLKSDGNSTDQRGVSDDRMSEDGDSNAERTATGKTEESMHGKGAEGAEVHGGNQSANQRRRKRIGEA